MGKVYLARDRDLEELVAIKVLRGETQARTGVELERFRSEVKMARQVTHPCVVRTFELGDAGGRPFITMEYVEGPSLKDLIQASGALPLGVGARLSRQVAEGLAAAHRQGVLHRDVKPQNVLVSPRGPKRSCPTLASRTEPVPTEGRPALRAHPPTWLRSKAEARRRPFERISTRWESCSSRSSAAACRSTEPTLRSSCGSIAARRRRAQAASTVPCPGNWTSSSFGVWRRTRGTATAVWSP